MKIEHDRIAKKTTEWYDRLYLNRYDDTFGFILESLLDFRQWLNIRWEWIYFDRPLEIVYRNE